MIQTNNKNTKEVKTMRVVYQITLPDKCFHIETLADVVMNADPAAQWMVGKPIPYQWIEQKNGQIKEVSSK